MSDKSKIEWCGSTWNPVTGCLHGCPYCYAARIANRFSGYDAVELHGQAAWIYGNGNLIIPAVYGGIEREVDGTLYTTKAQRTGCNMCGFGIHLEKRPHRFDLLRERNEKEWRYWMFGCCTDDEGNPYGWAKVLDYIGVGYLEQSSEIEGQQSLWGSSEK